MGENLNSICFRRVKNLGVMLLQTDDAQFAFFAHGGDGVGGGIGAGQCGKGDNTVLHRRATDGAFIVKGRTSERRIDDQVNFIALDQVHHVRAAFVDFEHALAMDAGVVQKACRAARGHDFEAQIVQAFGDADGVLDRKSVV